MLQNIFKQDVIPILHKLYSRRGSNTSQLILNLLALPRSQNQTKMLEGPGSGCRKMAAPPGSMVGDMQSCARGTLDGPKTMDKLSFKTSMEWGHPDDAAVLAAQPRRCRGISPRGALWLSAPHLGPLLVPQGPCLLQVTNNVILEASFLVGIEGSLKRSSYNLLSCSPVGFPLVSNSIPPIWPWLPWELPFLWQNGVLALKNKSYENAPEMDIQNLPLPEKAAELKEKVMLTHTQIHWWRCWRKWLLTRSKPENWSRTRAEHHGQALLPTSKTGAVWSFLEKDWLQGWTGNVVYYVYL